MYHYSSPINRLNGVPGRPLPPASSSRSGWPCLRRDSIGLCTQSARRECRVSSATWSRHRVKCHAQVVCLARSAHTSWPVLLGSPSYLSKMYGVICVHAEKVSRKSKRDIHHRTYLPAAVGGWVYWCCNQNGICHSVLPPRRSCPSRGTSGQLCSPGAGLKTQ